MSRGTNHVRVLHFVFGLDRPSETFVRDGIEALAAATADDHRVLSRNPSRTSRRNQVAVLTRKIPLLERFLSRLAERRRRPWPMILDRATLREVAQADLLHCHFLTLGISVFRALRASRRRRVRSKPLVISVHGSDYTDSVRLRPHWMEAFRDLPNHPNGMLLTPSGFLRDLLVAGGWARDRVCVTHNPIRVERIRTAAEPTPVDETLRRNELRLISVGRLIPCKAHDVLISALGRVRRIDPGCRFRLTLIGDGQDREALIRQATELGLSSHIVFRGYLSHHDTLAEMNQHDLLVHPGRVDQSTGQVETFGVVLAEAIALGLPVVAARVGGIPETLADVPDTHARLVTPDNASALADAIISLGRDGVPARLTVSESEASLRRFTSERYAVRVKEAYTRVLSMIEP